MLHVNLKLLLVFVIISALIFPIAATADGESEPSNSDELFELELIRVLGGPMCLSTSDPSCLFMDPTDIAIGESGNIYVADHRRNQIQILDSVGQLIQTIELKGLPHGIALDKYENIYVTEWWDWFGVEKFTKADEPSTFSHFPWPADDFQIEDQSVFKLPSDLVVDPNGIVYVLEHRNLEIPYGTNAGVHKLSADGSYLEFIPIPIQYLYDSSKFGLMTMDKDGYLYLLDQRGNNIIEMDPSNGDVRILDLFDFHRPNGIAFNQHGFMFISEQTDYRKQIYIFDESHQLVGSIGEYGQEDGKIHQSHGLEFDKDGNMYVVAYGEDKVQVFHIVSEVFGEPLMSDVSEDDPTFKDICDDCFGPLEVLNEPSLGDDLELLLVIGGKSCQVYADGCICQPGEDIGPNGERCLFSNPTDLAIGDSGNIYVADYRNKRIQTFDSVGQLIQTIELKGLPHGITLDKYENIYVTEWWDWFGVEKFTKTGEPAADFQIEDQSVFKLPSDLVVDPNGIVYVLEHRNLDIDYGKNAGVHKLSADGSYLEFVPIPDSAINDSSKFGLMTMDKAGYLYITDHRGNNIIEMDPSNGDVRVLDLIDFNIPNSVTFDADGYMFIGDNRPAGFTAADRPLDISQNGTIHIFDDHQLVGTIGEWGRADGQLWGNHGLEFDKNGNMYVLDYENHRIQVFHIVSEEFREYLKQKESSISDASSQPSGGGCLIATATFGSEMAPQVQFLREIRDNTVLQTESGVSFMAGFNQFYYSFSPAIADYERENPVFKEAVKLTLTPLLTSLTLLQYTNIDSEPEMLGYGIGIILLNIGMYFIAPAVVIMKIRSFYKHDNS